MDLLQTAIELLEIKKSYSCQLDMQILIEQGVKRLSDDDFDMYIFEQMWGNTSGGFEGMGGSAMTTQNTCVIVPKGHFKHDCMVFFGGTFCYKVPYSKEFMKDVIEGKVAGRLGYKKYLK